MTDPDKRARGLARMNEVYGWDIGEMPGEFFGITVEHLFGDIWTREGLSVRDRRLLLIGLLTSQGPDSILQVQIESALETGELREDHLREIVIFLAHYAGWPKAAALNILLDKALAKRAKAEGE